MTLFVMFGYLAGLAKVPPIYGPPLGEGRRILARSGRARMRPLGHMGTGEGSPRIRTPERTGGLYEQVVHLPAIPFQGNLAEALAPIAPGGGQSYTPAPRSRGLRGVLHI